MRNIYKNKTIANLLWIFTIFALVAHVVILVFIDLGIRKIYTKHNIKDAEQAALNIGRILFEQEKNMLLALNSEGKTIMNVAPEDFPRLDMSINKYLKPTDIIKIKVFSKDKKIIYSTDHSIIGQIDAHNEKLNRALGGEVISKLEKKDRVWDFKGEKRYNIDLVEAYLPVRGDNNEIIGSFEIYLDITQYQKAIGRILKSSMMLIGFLPVLIYGFLYVLMRRGTKELSEAENELKRYAKHLEEIVQERTRRLKEAHVQIIHKEKMAALGQMAADVAHEIGNPLSSLSSIVQSFDGNSVDNRSLEEKVQLMQAQINRIARIVREMIDFSRPVSYRERLTDINQVIQSALGISSYDTRLKGVRAITALDNEIPALKLDGDQLLQVFLNIIFNAADAMNGNGTLTVTSKLENNSAIVLFEDTGPGIPKDLLSRIFDPFFTTKGVGEGTGLGLSVSYGIMQNMGGMIRGSNRKAGGSVFIVEIPLAYSRESRG